MNIKVPYLPSSFLGSVVPPSLSWWPRKSIISRFRDDKKLCAYAGLVPSTYASGGKVFHGRITKMGNKWRFNQLLLFPQLATWLPSTIIRGGR